MEVRVPYGVTVNTPGGRLPVPDIGRGPDPAVRQDVRASHLSGTDVETLETFQGLSSAQTSTPSPPVTRPY